MSRTNLDTISAGLTLMDRYTITRKLGQGGFAVVYEARDAQVERHVAIKLLDVYDATETPEDDELRRSFDARFAREAKAAARILHPNVMTIHDYGVLPDWKLPYIVMELLEGLDLDQYLRTRGAIAPERLIPLFIPALEALGMAHDLGIVHRDLKPSNLFLRFPDTSSESLCVVDFGIAHLQDTKTRLTQTGHVVGTPAYVAPEYATSQQVSPALDVYQMGLILVECLSGRPVVAAPESLIAMFQHVYGNITVPEVLLDSPLGPILQKALAWDPDRRYLNGHLFANALRALDLSAVPDLTTDATARISSVSLKRHPSRTLAGLPPLLTPDQAPTLDQMTESELAAFGDTMDLALAQTTDLGITPTAPRQAPAATPTREEPAAPASRQGGRGGVVLGAALVALGVAGGIALARRGPPDTPPVPTRDMGHHAAQVDAQADSRTDPLLPVDPSRLLDPNLNTRTDAAVRGVLLGARAVLERCLTPDSALHILRVRLELQRGGTLTRAQLLDGPEGTSPGEAQRACLLHELSLLAYPGGEASAHTITLQLRASRRAPQADMGALPPPRPVPLPRAAPDMRPASASAPGAPAVRALVRQHMNDLRRCFVQHTSADASAPAVYTLDASLDVAPRGTVLRARLAPHGAATWRSRDALHRCLLDHMSGWHLPPAPAQRTLTVPLRLSRAAAHRSTP